MANNKLKAANFESDYTNTSPKQIDSHYSPEYLAWRNGLTKGKKGAAMTEKKAVTFDEAMKAADKPEKPADSRDNRSRFVETGEGLKVIRSGDKAEKGEDGKPKMVPMEDLLLDVLEEKEEKEAAKVAKDANYVPRTGLNLLLSEDDED
jgi:hypothetical protein